MHRVPDGPAVELVSAGTLFRDAADALQLMAENRWRETNTHIIWECHLAPEFSDLSIKIAGEILQKFSTYQMNRVIIGDFSVHRSPDLKDFIRESNRRGQISFFPTLQAALQIRND